ncbi:MAG: M1 family metallopeptidase [Cyclobacteriaceae bacterium]|nr:M1 family metallopeptidase [Cyclobacteriaceae bacterium]
MRKFLIIPLLVIQTILYAADNYPRNEAIDIRHYLFKLEINDSTNQIAGETTVTVLFKKSISDFELDLTNINAQGQGMKVIEILLDQQVVKFTHQNDRLKIILPNPLKEGDEKKFIIKYSGIPQDGLVISKNKFGDRTFFGDNWPNRAHHWLPTIDHPYDKATCEFIVTAPAHYTVIATGEKLEESVIGKNTKLTHWKTSVVLPTKVMVMGAARFAIEYEGKVNGISVEAWVYPQNRLEGFSDYAIAAKCLEFFSKTIAPYPYEKLANVQSTTRYGGMENAGNIFYYENSVTGKNTIEGLVAHEVAHQWFGNSASENDWHHVWLSEGLSTYSTQLYLENAYGSKKLMEEMEKDRKQVINYFLKSPAPIVNTSITDITKVLNTNSYQKGSWILHMLRHEIGDENFFNGLRTYYKQYQLSNAMTDDFRKVMEAAAGKDLKGFFDQWIFRSGQPKLEVSWTYDQKRKQTRVTVEQKQADLFTFPLEVEVTNKLGNVKVDKIDISGRKQEFLIHGNEQTSGIRLDPAIWLLFEGTVKQTSK